MLSLFLILIQGLISPAAPDLVIGADRLSEVVASLKGKRVALVANQASKGRFGHTIDHALGLKINLKKLFALEHGVRGDQDAGETVPDTHDPISGLPIISLYGANKKPTPAMLAEIDVVLFDIQDVGVRFYTYISSLGLIMQAAFENKKSVMVLDRPNPNIEFVEGPILRKGFESFVGMFPIPVVYGLSIGELALMIRGENWLNTRGMDLTVLKMENYERTQAPSLTANPSPNLRSPQAIKAYPSLALFEPTKLSIGKGTPDPYSRFGLPDAKFGPDQFIPRQEVGRPQPKYLDQICYGQSFSGKPLKDLPSFTTDFLRDSLLKLKGQKVIEDPRFLSLLLGDPKVLDQIKAGASYQMIRKSFENELKLYDKRRRRYLLY